MRRIAGKVIGTIVGFLLGGPLGALVGFVLGHMRDIAPQIAAEVDQVNDAKAQRYGFSSRFQQSTYTVGVIVLSAKMAKSDGRVVPQEIEAFRRVFNIPDDRVGEVGLLFDQARLTPLGYEPYAERLAQVFRYRPGVLEEILTGLFFVALADSAALSQAEDVFLRRVAGIFRFTEQDYVRIAARAGINRAEAPSRSNPDDEAYAILGLSQSASDAEIKKTYRALIRKHHPDKLVSQGLPPELISQATEKMKRINGAYTQVCKLRGIK